MPGLPSFYQVSNQGRLRCIECGEPVQQSAEAAQTGPAMPRRSPPATRRSGPASPARPPMPCTECGVTRRVCSEPGCPVLVPASAYRGRCDTHRKQWDRQRGSREQRGYGRDHLALAADWQRRLDAGEQVACANPNCFTPSHPVDPRPGYWHLGHTPDRAGYRGPEHPVCNLAEAGRAQPI